MKLIRCYIENFGGLHQYPADFRDGLTVIHAPNGFGKTTLAEFIRAMFYGFPRASKDIGKNPRLKYLPWQGGLYGGYLVFEHEGRHYRMERSFGETPKGDKFKLIDEATHKEIRDFSANIGYELFGLDAESFLRSTYMPQTRNSGPLSTDQIRAKLGNLLEDTEDVGSYEKAMQRLREKRSTYEFFRGQGGSIHETSRRITDLQQQIDDCRAKQPLMDEVTAEIDAVKQEQRATDSTLQQIRTQISDASRAEAEAALSREYEGLLSARDEANTRLDDLLTRYPKGIPTEAELDTAIERSIAFRDTEISPQESYELSKLHGFFVHGVPEDAALDTCRNCLQELNREETLYTSLTLSPEDTARIDALNDFFHAGIPNAALPEQLEQKLGRAEQLRRDNLQLSAVPQTATMPHKRFHSLFFPALILGILAAAAGICLLVLEPLPAFLAAYPSVLAHRSIIGGSFAASALILLLVAVLMQNNHNLMHKLQLQGGITDRQRRLMEENERSAAALEAEVATALAVYPADTNASLHSQISRLQTNLAQYRSLMERQAALAEQKEACGNRICTLTDKLAEALRPYFTDITDYDTALTTLTLKKARYSALLEKQGSADVLTHLQQKHRAFCETYALPVEIFQIQILAKIRYDAQAFPQLTADAAHAEAALNQFIAAYGHKPAPKQPMYEISLDQLKHAEETLLKRQTALNARLLQLEQRRRLLREEIDRIHPLTDTLTRCIEQKAEDTERRRLLDCTMSFLEQARESLSASYLGGVQGHFAKYMNRLTGEQPRHIAVNTDLEVQLERGGASRPMPHFSAGQSDIAELCMRLALSDALFAGGKCFMILDDPFVNLDDAHTAQALALLRELSEERQIIYLVCNTSRTL